MREKDRNNIFPISATFTTCRWVKDRK